MTAARPAIVEVWCIDLVRGSSALLDLDQRYGIASAADRAKSARVVDPEAGRRRLAATVALRLLLERHADAASIRGQPFTITAAGKPSLPLPGGPHFSLAHSGPLALVALADGPVGVDIEMPREVAMDDRRRRAIEDAAGRCAKAALPDGGSRLLQAWTRLEALAKADGCGIGRLLGAIGAFGPAQAACPALLDDLAARFDCHDLDLAPRCDGAMAALATSAGGRAGLRIRDLPPSARDIVDAIAAR